MAFKDFTLYSLGSEIQRPFRVVDNVMLRSPEKTCQSKNV